MKLMRLVYVSDATRPFSEAELVALVDHSSRSNLQQDVTGLLLASGGHFLQVLEGDRVRTAGLYARITRDRRHERVQKLLWEPAPSRLFPDWGMQLVTPDRLPLMDREVVQQTMLNLRLLLDSADARDAIAALQEFRAQLSAAA